MRASTANQKVDLHEDDLTDYASRVGLGITGEFLEIVASGIQLFCRILVGKKNPRFA